MTNPSEFSAQAAPATPVDLGGGTSVVALTDAVADHRQPIEECFPGRPAAGWTAVRQQYPETIGGDGRWRLAINTFLVRTPTMTLLVDCGVGCARTLAAEVFRVVGSLPERLARAGVTLDAVDAVFFTHLHEDHLGWADDPDTGEPTFPNARYLVFRGEWVTNHDEDTPAWVEQALDPLMERRRIELIELGSLQAGIEVVALPGHTPGHCGLVVSGHDARVTLVGDAFNHPLQVAEPSVPSVADRDSDQATATRRMIRERAVSGEWPLFGSAHLPRGWWRAETQAGGWRWRVVDPAPSGGWS